MQEKILRTTFIHTTRKPFYIYAALVIEILIISLQITNTNTMVYMNNEPASFLKQANLVNPFYLFQYLFTCNMTGEYNLCSFSNSTQVYFLLIMIVILIIFCVNSYLEDEIYLEDTKNNMKESFFKKINRRLSIFLKNFLFFIIHVCGIVLLFVFINNAMMVIYSWNSNSLTNVPFSVVIFIFSLLFLFFLIKWNISYFQNLNVLVRLGNEINFHSDSIFSKEYNYFILYMKILTSLENNFILFEATEDSNGIITYSNKISFLNMISVLSYLIFTFYILFRLERKKILYVTNFNYNLVRIFFLIFFSIFILITFIFSQSLTDQVLFALTIITIFFFSLFLCHYIRRKNLANILSGKSPILQLAYVISNRDLGSSVENNEDIFQIFITHKLNCNMLNVSSDKHTDQSRDGCCPICEERNYTLESFLKSFLTAAKVEKKKNLGNITKEEYEIYKMIKLSYFYILNKNKIFQTYFRIIKLFSKEKIKENNHCLYLNITILKKLINQNSSEDIQMSRIIKTHEEISDLLRRAIEINDEIYFNYEHEKELFRKAESIYNLKNEILKRMIYLSKQNEKDFYSIIIFKKIYEQLFNTNLDYYFSSLNAIEMDYKLSENYFNDKILIIKYEVASDNLTVIKTSNELKKLNKKKFEDMFPDEIKIFAKKNILKLINDNETQAFNLDLIIKSPDAEMFIGKISLKGKIFPSINFDEFIISSTYELSTEELLMFQENFHNGSKTFLKTYSKNAGQILCLNNDMINYLGNYKFTFDDIFEKKKKLTDNKVSKSSSKGFARTSIKNLPSKKGEEYNINLPQYLNLCVYMNRIHNTNEEQLINIDQLMKLTKEEGKERKYIIKLIQTIQTENKIFTVYSLKMSSIKQNMKTLRNKLDDLSDEETEFQKNLLNPYTPSTLSYVSNTERDIAQLNNTKQAHLSKNRTVNLHKLTITASLFIIFLIIFCFSFMILGVINSNKVTDSYNILINYLKLKKLFLHTSSSLFNKFYIANPNGNSTLPNLSAASYVYNIDSDINFENIEFVEVQIKLKGLYQRMLLFQSIYLATGYKNQVDQLMENTAEYYTISNRENQYTIQTSQKNYFDNLKNFKNLGDLITNVDQTILIYPINYLQGNIDLSNIQNKNLEDIQIFALEIVINYLNFFRQSEIISIELQNLHNDNLNSIYKTNLIFTLCFCVFHGFLIFVCFRIIRSLKILISTYLKLIDVMLCEKNIIYMKKKLSILKVLNELYLDDPSKLLRNLDKNKSDILQSIREEKKEKLKAKDSFISQENKLNKTSGANSTWNYANRSRNSLKEIINPMIKRILVFFSLFYIYCLIFYILVTEAHNSFSQSSLAFSMCSENENTLYINYNLQQILFLNNLTDSSLYEILSDVGVGEPETFYIKDSIKFIDDQAVKIIDILKVDPAYISLFMAQQNLMNCDFIYTQLNDSMITMISNKFQNPNSVIEFLIEVCSTLSFMNTGNPSLIKEEVNYQLQIFLARYGDNLGDPEKVFNMYYEPTLYNLYFYLSYIFRPIMNVINYNIIFLVVESKKGFYLLLLLLFLSLNIVVEICIFLYIKFQIIKTALYVGTYVENFINMIKIA